MVPPTTIIRYFFTVIVSIDAFCLFEDCQKVDSMKFATKYFLQEFLKSILYVFVVVVVFFNLKAFKIIANLLPVATVGPVEIFHYNKPVSYTHLTLPTILLV